MKLRGKEVLGGVFIRIVIWEGGHVKCLRPCASVLELEQSYCFNKKVFVIHDAKSKAPNLVLEKLNIRNA